MTEQPESEQARPDRRADNWRFIETRDGPSGPHAALIGSRLGVWQVVSTEPDIPEGPERVRAVAEYLKHPVEQIEAAFAYYAAHRAEVDDLIARNRAEADEAYAQWLATTSPHRD